MAMPYNFGQKIFFSISFQLKYVIVFASLAKHWPKKTHSTEVKSDRNIVRCFCDRNFLRSTIYSTIVKHPIAFMGNFHAWCIDIWDVDVVCVLRRFWIFKSNHRCTTVLLLLFTSIIEQSTNKQMRILFFVVFASEIERLYVIIAQYKYSIGYTRLWGHTHTSHIHIEHAFTNFTMWIWLDRWTVFFSMLFVVVRDFATKSSSHNSHTHTLVP